MPKTTAQLRELWDAFECKEVDMVVVPFGPDRIRVAPPTAAAWDALAAVMTNHGYQIRTKDTDSYNCRQITGGTGRSLHSYGIALDVNWTTNPFINHGDKRKVRFSNKPTQDERARDVRMGVADTDMTPGMIADVEAIKTKDGTRVFEWGGSWETRKDCMHFELDVSPAELAKGIDPATVKGWPGVPAPAAIAAPQPSPLRTGLAFAQLATLAGTAEPPGLAPTPVPQSAGLFTVVARGGLRLRSAPSETAGIVQTLPTGTAVRVMSREGSWALVDLQGDGLADGFVFFSFLRPASASETGAAPAPERTSSTT